MARVSVKAAARHARTMDKSARKASASQTHDSFQNFMLGVGIGTNSAITANSYGYNPITRERTRLEWQYRGSWAAGIGVDIIADDMTREGVEIIGNLDPDQVEAIEEEAVSLGIWKAINQTIKWARLYGGCIAVLLIDGQDYSKPLRIETVGPDQFRGLLVLDRWMVYPSLDNLVTEIGPNLGLPKFYTVEALAPALRGTKIHYSRCIRLVGDDLPYWQFISENMWGMSVLERLNDRLTSFDQATIGAAQLVYKAYLRYFKVKDYRKIIATGGPAYKGLVEQVQAMRMFASNEGISLIDSEDDLVTTQMSSLTGIAECLLQLGQQISGGWQIPLVRLFGQSPAGLNSTGESDLKTFYDGIRKRQNLDLKVGVTKAYRCLARSLRIPAESGFGIKFRSLWQLDDAQKSEIAERDTRSAIAVMETGKISDQTFLKELQRMSATTGRWESITNEEVDAANDQVEPPAPELPQVPGAEAVLNPDGERKEEVQA